MQETILQKIYICRNTHSERFYEIGSGDGESMIVLGALPKCRRDGALRKARRAVWARFVLSAFPISKTEPYNHL